MYRSQNRLGGLAPTLGVLLDWVGDPYQIDVLRGLEAGALAAGANLLCFVGGTLSEDESGNPAQRVYDLASAHCVDGVALLASTLVHRIGSHGLVRYCERFRPLPVCSIGVELEGIPSLTVDNESGMRDAVLHLLREHEKSRVAFVRGPDANTEAELRFDAYRDALGQRGLAFDERLVVQGNFTHASGFNAISELEKRFGRRLDGVDAIVAANDGMALGALRALGELQIDVPGRIALVGFDDTEDARLSQPPLSTVRQPLEKLGQRAVRALLEAAQHRARPESARLGTEQVMRVSCGCSSVRGDRNRRSVVPDGNYSFEASLVVRRQHILDSVTRAAQGALGPAGHDWPGRLLSALISDLGEQGGVRLETELQAIMDKLLARGVDLNICDHVIGALRRQILPSLKTDGERRDRAEELFHFARLATSSTIQRALARDRLQTVHGARHISWACNSLTASFGHAELRERLLEQLPRLGIDSCFIALYDENGGAKAGRLFFGYDQGKEKLFPAEALFEQKALLPKEWVHAGQSGRSFVVMPLICRKRSYGHVLASFNLAHAFAYGALAEAIGSALYGAELAERAG
jgi:DNA-binding LacI/PurR family transcriptional regulator